MTSESGPKSTAVRREEDRTWGANVRPGGETSEGDTDVRRYYYRTRDQARRASAADEIGERGRVR